jgi:hypothetical protein
VSRRAPAWLSREWGDVYTLHLWPKFGDPEVQASGHYTGFAHLGRLGRRLADHALGRGALLTRLQLRAGGSWVLADVERGVTKDRETQLKERAATRRCSVCKALRRFEAGHLGAAEALTRAGWERASEHDRRLLLEMFALAAVPGGLSVRPAPEPEPEVTLWTPKPAEFTAEQQAEMDALVDGLCAKWAADPDAWRADPKAEYTPDREMEMEAG